MPDVQDLARRRLALKRAINTAGYIIPADTHTEALELIVALIKPREERPAAVIIMDGGVIQDVTVSTEIDIMVIDYDVDTMNPDYITKVDWGNEHTPKDANVYFSPIEVATDYVNGRLKAYRESDGKAC